MIELLPQQPTPVRAEIASVEWLVEPFWPGVRVIARREGDDIGTTPDLQDVTDALRGAVQAEQAVVDGIWTSQPFPSEDRRAFVAVDLLELDGEPLLDLPLQERRRLLESVIRESESVRLSPIVKHPVDGWLATWRASGFTHYLAKRQNARYAAGEQNQDWLKVPIVLDTGGGFVGRVIGSRQRVRRIGD
jgi:ATP-dependent DNA ligase